jgi:hypothetical protein
METALNGFDEFWKVYPRRVAKQAALRMYKQALKKTTPEHILSAAKKYAAERIGQDAQFTKHPSTWLNGGCWGDYDTDLTKAPTSATAAPAKVYVKFINRDAWDAYGRRVNGKSYPQDRAGGWWFPSEWPPNLRGEGNETGGQQEKISGS